MAYTKYEHKIDGTQVLWTRPKVWKANSPLFSSDFNAQLRDNIQFLREKPRHIIQLTDGTSADDIVNSSNDWAMLSSSLKLSLDMPGGDILLTANLTWIGTDAGNIAAFDWLFNGQTYLSTLSDTPNDFGIGWHDVVDNSDEVYTSLQWVHFNVPAGVNTWDFYWRDVSATGQLETVGELPIQVSAIYL